MGCVLVGLAAVILLGSFVAMMLYISGLDGDREMKWWRR